MQFTPQEETTLSALCNCLIPPDDYPGAWEAGAGDYITHLLATDAKHLQDTYRLGLNALNAEAQARHQTDFATLSAEAQTTLLQDVEAGDVRAHWMIHPPTLFSLWVNHTAEGYYSDPANGGNRDALSWEMIGYEKRNVTL
jgi:hypothetical protein